MAQPYLAYDPASRLVYGVGLSPREARDDAEFQAGVVVGGSEPWKAPLATRACTIAEARMVEASNGPPALADIERAAAAEVLR